MRYPNLFLAGAPKCGTTSLAYYLGQHPKVFAPLVKEPGYFGSDLLRKTSGPSEEQYLQNYSLWSDDIPYAIDGTTAYFYSKRAAEEIFRSEPNARIIVSLRNPVDAAYSMFSQNIYNYTEPLGDFKEALNAEIERKRTKYQPDFGYGQRLWYRSIYTYSKNIGNFAKAFPASQVYFVIFDDLAQNPFEIVSGIIDWLGVEPICLGDMDFSVKNPSKVSRLRTLNALANYPPAWLGTLARPFLSKNTRVRIRQVIGRLNTIYKENPPIEPDTRQLLAETFRPDVLWLSEYLQRDLSHWLTDDK